MWSVGAGFRGNGSSSIPPIGGTPETSNSLERLKGDTESKSRSYPYGFPNCFQLFHF